jgi:DNA/RNA-binding domain of Phe-tRNA-synthetase-like protein
MKFIVEYDIFRIFPDLRVGVVLGRGLRIRRHHQELENLIEDIRSELIHRIGNKNLTDFLNIKAWNETYRQLGINTWKYKPTVEELIRRVITGNDYRFVNTSVNAYQAVELLTMLPIGGYNLGAIEGDIRLRISRGGELFKPLGEMNLEFTNPGEIVYADSRAILTRHWNYRKGDHAKITENSEVIFLLSEAALKDISTQDIIETLVKIVEFESTFCQGTYSTFIIDNINPEVELK